MCFSPFPRQCFTFFSDSWVFILPVFVDFKALKNVILNQTVIFVAWKRAVLLSFFGSNKKIIRFPASLFRVPECLSLPCLFFHCLFLSVGFDLCKVWGYLNLEIAKLNFRSRLWSQVLITKNAWIQKPHFFKRLKYVFKTTSNIQKTMNDDNLNPSMFSQYQFCQRLSLIPCFTKILVISPTIHQTIKHWFKQNARVHQRRRGRKVPSLCKKLSIDKQQPMRKKEDTKCTCTKKYFVQIKQKLWLL